MSAGGVYQTTVQVGPGHRIEIVAPELVEGELVEVTVRSAKSPTDTPKVFSALKALDLPVQNEAYWHARERELQDGRESWDR
jgi:hypothetical protein